MTLNCTDALAPGSVDAGLALLVDATGSARRLRALAYMGWNPAALASRLSVSLRRVVRVQLGLEALIPAPLAGAVAALYDQLWDVRGGSEASAQSAARRDWCPPLAWDDDADDGHGIDDPAAVPADCWKPAGRVPLVARLEDAVQVMPAGSTTQHIAWRLGITRNHLTVVLSRNRATRAGASS